MKNFLRVAALLVALLVGSNQLLASDAANKIQRLDGSQITATELDARIKSITEAAQVHGLAIAVFNENKPVYTRAFGYADQPNKKALHFDTEFYGASLSKAVFAVLVMKLVEQNVIDLDQPLQSYLEEPLWKNRGGDWHENLADLEQEPRYKNITARMCLSHTTGLPNWRWFEPDHKLRLHFTPGERYLYSGEGMVLLQIVLEKLTGKGLEQLAQELVFAPYKMSMSSYRWQAPFEKDYALGHNAQGETYPKDKDNSPRAPSTLETTPTDYVRFMTAVLQQKGLSKSSWQEIFSPQIRIRSRTQFGPGANEQTDAFDHLQISYGLGWGLLQTPRGIAAFKEAHGDGFQHYTIIFPKQGIGVMLMSNSDNAESAFGYLLEASIADHYTPLKWQGYIPFDQR